MPQYQMLRSVMKTLSTLYIYTVKTEITENLVSYSPTQRFLRQCALKRRQINNPRSFGCLRTQLKCTCTLVNLQMYFLADFSKKEELQVIKTWLQLTLVYHTNMQQVLLSVAATHTHTSPNGHLSCTHIHMHLDLTSLTQCNSCWLYNLNTL